MKADMKADHLRRGEHAEHQARQYLESHGLTFVESNYRCPPGEIDLIMSDRHTIVFVEVRYRKDQSHGGALESIDARKQHKLRAAALHYLQHRHGTAEVPCRIDVVLVSGNIDPPRRKTDGDADVDWIADAI